MARVSSEPVVVTAEELEVAETSEDVPGTEPSLRLVVVTGMSGAGRSTAANALEDLGWYVVDNLPPRVLPEVCTQAKQNGIHRLAVVLDVRTRSFFEQLPSMFTELTAAGTMPEILFLEAADDVIVRRQESVRRPHPLQGDGRLLDGITRERETIATLRAAADLVIDTSSINIHQLSSRVAHAYGGRRRRRPPGHRGLLRLQERHPGRRRPGGGRPVPAQPALGAGAATADRPQPARPRLRAGAGRRRGVPASACRVCSR